MKKALALLLTAIILIAVSASAFAEGDIATVQECGNGACKMVLWDDRDQLPTDQKEVFAAAKATLKDPLPAEYVCVLFAYHNAEKSCSSCDIVFLVNDAAGKEAAAAGACEVYKISSPVKKNAEIIARQFVNGEWVRKEAAFDGKEILVKDMVAAPLALYQWTPGNPVGSVTPSESPHVNPPELIFKGCDGCKIVSWRNRGILAAEKKSALEEAKKQLKDAVPDGFACRDLVYQDVTDSCTACDIGMLMASTKAIDKKTEAEWVHEMKAKGVCSGYRVSLSLDGVSEVAVKQYLNKTWVEKTVDVDMESNSIVIKAVVDGPVAIFMK